MDKPHGKEEVTKAILEAAIPLIAEKGVVGVTFRDIADKAGVNHTLIARHFGTKDELIQQVGNYLGYKLFNDAKDQGGLPLALWSRLIGQNPTEVRAVARILLDKSPQETHNLASRSLMKEVFDWFKTGFQFDGENSKADTHMMIFLTASLVVGSEIFAPHVQAILELSDQEFQELRPRAFQFFLTHLVPGVHP